MADSTLADKNSRLAISEGRHPVKGYQISKRVDLTGSSKVVVYRMGLGLGEWDVCEGLYYRGNPIAPADFVFHPGGPVDTPDDLFPGESYPGAAYVNVRLRGAFAEDDNPDNIEGVYRTLKHADYNGAGQQIDSNGQIVPVGATPRDYFFYSANPPREMVDLIIRWGLRRATTIDWEGWVDWRDDCAQLINWNDGTTVRQIPRFEAHLFFMPPFYLSDAMRRIAEVCCAEWQRGNGKLYFLTPHARNPIFTFDLTKLPLGAFKTYPVDRTKKPNQVIVYFRDLDTPFLTPAGEDGAAPIVNIERALAPNEERKPFEINLGGAYASQAQRVGEYYARTKCDLDQVAEFEGAPDSYPVLPSDVIELSDVVPTWNGVKFKILDKEENEDTKLGYQMTGTLYSPDAYSDTEHGPIERPLPPADPNQFAAPPQVTSVSLEERNILQADQSVVTSIKVTAQFALYVNQQLGRVIYKKASEDDSLYKDYGVITPNPDTLEGSIEIKGVEKTSYVVKVVPESSFASAGRAGATPYPITITGKIIAPNPASSIVFTDLPSTGQVRLSFTKSPDGDVQTYKLVEVLGALEVFLTDLGLTTEYVFPHPSAARTFKVYAVNASGFSSSVLFSPQATYTPTFPPLVTITALEPKFGSTLGFNRYGQILLVFTFGAYSTNTSSQYAKVFITRQGEEEAYVQTVHPVPDGSGGYYGKLYIDFYRLGDHTVRIQTFTLGGQSSGNSVSQTVNADNSIYNNAPWQAQLLPGSPQLVWNGTTIEATWTKSQAANVRYQLSRNNTFTQIVYEDTSNTAVPFKALATGTQTYYLRAIDSQSNTSATVSGVVTVTAPSQPGVITPTEDGEAVTLPIPSTSGAAYFLVTDDNTGTSTLIDAVQGGVTHFKAPVTSGRTVYNFSVNALNGGLFASTTRTVSYTIPDPSLPSGFAIAFVDGMYVNHRLTVSANYQYQYATANDGTGILTTAKGAFDELLGTFTSRTITRYARTLHKSGKTSAWVPASITIAAPSAPTVTKDATRQNEVFVVLHVAPPSAPNRVKYTVIQTRAVGGAFPANANSNTDNQIRYPGVKEEIVLDFTAGQSIEYRVCYEDAFSSSLNDRNWSATGSHTFARFQDIAIDPTSALSKLAAEAGPIMTGGGTINVSSGGVVSWSSAFTVGPLPAGFSPTGQMTISADSRNPNINQIVIARHTKGSAAAASIVVTDMSTYTPPAHDSSTYDRWIVWRRPDGKWKFYNGLVLDATQSFGADSFIPYLSTLEAIMGVAKIGKLNVLDVYAKSIVAADGTFNHIVMGGPIESSTFVDHGSTTPQIETVKLSLNPSGGTSNDDGSFTRTGSGTYLGAVGERALFYGDGYVEFTPPAAGAMIGFKINSTTPAVSVGGAGDTMYGLAISGVDNQIYYNEGPGGFVGTGVIWALGDKLRVEVSGTNILYKRITSAGTSTTMRTIGRGSSAWYPMYPFVAAISAMTIQPVTVYGLLAPSVGVKVRPVNIVGVTLDSNDDFTGGGGGSWGSAGFASADVLPAGTVGRVDFSFGSHPASDAAAVGFSTSDTDQSYVSTKISLLNLNGNLYMSEPAVGTFSLGTTITSGDVFTLERLPSGLFHFRKNGISLGATSFNAYTQALIVDTAFNTANSRITNLRFFQGGAIGQGWKLPNNGPGKLHQGFEILDVKVDDLRARSVKLYNSEGLFISTDFGPVMLHKITDVKLEAWWIADDGTEECNYQLSVAWPMDTDEYANVKSVRQCKVRVLNHFGEEIRAAQKFTFLGDGTCAQGRHKYRYAHPELEAIYAVSFYNGFKWSQEIYMRAGAKYLSFNSVPKNRRSTSPLELTAARTVKGATLGWILPSASGGQYSVHFRMVGGSWVNTTTNVPSHINSLALPDTGYFTSHMAKALLADTWYEARVRNLTTGEYSNTVRFKTYPPYNATTTTEAPAFGLYAAGEANSPNPHWVTLTLVTPGYVAANGDECVIYRLAHSTGTITELRIINPILPTGPTTVSDTTTTGGETYTYWAVVEYTNTPNRSMATEPVTVTTNAYTSKDPYNFHPYAVYATSKQIRWRWTLGTSTGNITFQWAYYNAAFLANPTWNDISLGSVSAIEYLQTVTANAANDPIIARVKVADAGSNGSNTNAATLEETPQRDY